MTLIIETKNWQARSTWQRLDTCHWVSYHRLDASDQRGSEEGFGSTTPRGSKSYAVCWGGVLEGQSSESRMHLWPGMLFGWNILKQCFHDCGYFPWLVPFWTDVITNADLFFHPSSSETQRFAKWQNCWKRQTVAISHPLRTSSEML